MARFTFFGGILPYDGKDMSKNRPIKTIFPQGEMVYPLSQHIGKPSIPVVKVGDHVLTGQLIAKASTDISANLHASVSGEVIAIEDRFVADGRKERSIVIDNDGLYEEIYYPENRHLYEQSKRDIIQAVKNAGVVGMGGSGLPTHIKLEVPEGTRIDYCIANCVECEPYLTSDYRRMLENPAKVVNGLKILLKVFPKARGIIAVSDDKSDCYTLFKKMTKDDPTILVKKLETKYPQGSERQLIYALTGRTLNAKMLPYEIGCVVNNVDTLVAMNQAVMVHEPLLTRIITVTGNAVRRPGNFRVRIGMSYRELIDKAGGLKVNPELLLNGGPMMGNRLSNLDVPITKLSSAIVAIRKDRVNSMPETSCIRCGRCVMVCPNHLLPLKLYEDCVKEKEDLFITHNGLECCECGSCSYICPAKKPLSDHITRMREQLLSEPSKVGDYARRYTRT